MIARFLPVDLGFSLKTIPSELEGCPAFMPFPQAPLPYISAVLPKSLNTCREKICQGKRKGRVKSSLGPRESFRRIDSDGRRGDNEKK
jgi:hypothetical protein